VNLQLFAINLLNIDVGLERIGLIGGLNEVSPQTYFLICDFSIDLQILKMNLQLFAINLLNIGDGLK
jgi:hypothetical protein